MHPIIISYYGKIRPFKRLSQSTRLGAAASLLIVLASVSYALLGFGGTMSQANEGPTDAASRADQSTGGWLKLEQCAVLVERSVDVPAQESGVLQSVSIELNQTVVVGDNIAELDRSLAETEVRLAELQLQAALKLANDRSDIEFHALALREVQEELSSYQRISDSVSESEIRKLGLSVEKSKLALSRSEQSLERARLEAEMQAAAVQASKQRLARRGIATPLAGVVASVEVHAGQWVEAGQKIARIENMEYLIADSLVPIRDVNLASLVGAEVRADVLQTTTPARLSGTITSFDHKVSSQGFVRVHARLRNVRRDDQWLLLPGMNVDMYVSQ